MVELIVVLLFILALSLGGIELSRLLRLASAAGLTREITAGAFRDCWFPATQDVTAGGRDATIIIVKNCLQDVINNSNASIQEVIPGAKITLSAYKWEPTRTPRANAYGQASTELVPPSRISTNDFLTDPTRLLLTNHGVLIYGEIYLPFTSTVPVIPKLLGFSAGEIYNIAVF